MEPEAPPESASLPSKRKPAEAGLPDGGDLRRGGGADQASDAGAAPGAAADALMQARGRRA
jgi:hypothetical protein